MSIVMRAAPYLAACSAPRMWLASPNGVLALISYPIAIQGNSDAITHPGSLCPSRGGGESFKWVNFSHASVRNVLRDLLRLALVKQSEPSAEWLSVLAEGNPRVESLLSKPPLAAPSEAVRRIFERPRPGRDLRKRVFPLMAHGKDVATVRADVEILPALRRLSDVTSTV